MPPEKQIQKAGLAAGWIDLQAGHALKTVMSDVHSALPTCAGSQKQLVMKGGLP